MRGCTLKTLFIDSSRKSLSVALANEDKLVFVSNVNSYSKHSNFLMNEISKILNKFNLSDIISQDDIDKLIAFAKKYQNTSAIDSQEVLNQLNKLSGSLKNQLSGLFNKAQSEGWFDKIINFIKSLFN